MDLVLREGTPEDLPALARLVSPLGASDADIQLTEGRLAIELKDEVVRYVAEADGKLVGLVTVGKLGTTLTRYLLHHKEHPLGNFELGRLFVHPAYRRRGIGKALLGSVNYLGRVLVTVKPHETVAQFFLRSAGRTAHGRFNLSTGPVLVMAQRQTFGSKPLRTTERIRPRTVTKA